MLTESVEMYLLTIYHLTDYHLTESEPRAKTGRIAAALGVHLSSASEMLKRLEEAGYVTRKMYKGATLTAQGRQAALNRLRKRRLLETFLVEMAGYRLNEAPDEAHGMSHVISDRLADSLDKMLGYPQVDPQGYPIPAADGTTVDISLVPLSEAPVGETAVIRRIGDNDGEKLRYLCDLGLVPGTQVQVVDIAPFRGPVTLVVTEKETVIANELAQGIGVEVCGNWFGASLAR